MSKQRFKSLKLPSQVAHWAGCASGAGREDWKAAQAISFANQSLFSDQSLLKIDLFFWFLKIYLTLIGKFQFARKGFKLLNARHFKWKIFATIRNWVRTISKSHLFVKEILIDVFSVPINIGASFSDTRHRQRLGLHAAQVQNWLNLRILLDCCWVRIVIDILCD